MAETQISVHKNPIFELHSVDPISLILSQNTNNIIPLKLTTETYHSMERGPRYNTYSQLRETKLRIKKLKLQQQGEQEESVVLECRDEPVLTKTPPPLTNNNNKRQQSSRRVAMAVAQSVPDFSLTKENRKPVNANVVSRAAEFTPPVVNKVVRFNGVGTTTPPSSSNKTVRFKGVSSMTGTTPPSSKRGSKSVNVGGEKKGLMARKSCASIEELRGVKGSSRKIGVRFREF